MIGTFTYDQILQISKELSENIEVIENLSKKQGADILQTFISNVTWYATFLKSTVELYKDADEVLAHFKK